VEEWAGAGSRVGFQLLCCGVGEFEGMFSSVIILKHSNNTIEWD